ncbi:MAG: hypothetical protein ACOVQG_05440 [Crocinitomicaceae bacterium]|jgi:hypothetical protein
MNYLLEKKQILELKLELTSILIDKKECIRYQQYEKVADLRMKEKELEQLLHEKNQELIEIQKNFEEQNHSVEDYYLLLSLINELSIHYTPFKHHEETIEDFYVLMKKDFAHLIQLKDDLVRSHKLKEAEELQNQILGIGHFLNGENNASEK